MDFINSIITSINGVLDYVKIIILLATGVFITIRLGFIQVRHLKHAINVTRGKYDNPADAGDITHFQALSTALSATIGIGNIAGVAMAIHYGGPGALFWMWVIGLLGTSLKYAECTLAMKFRKIKPDGSAAGGPMYYIEQAMGWKGMAVLFAVATAISTLGQGNMIQSNTVAMQLKKDFNIYPWIVGIIITIIVALVIIGGIKRIARVTQFLAPGMTVLYLLGGLVIIFIHVDKIPEAFSSIIAYAFKPHGVVGGFAGATFLQALQWGIKRGLFSNEAGQGSAAIAHSAAKTKEPVREGTVAMLGPYIDTIIICTITGLCIIVTGVWHTPINGKLLNGSPLTAEAFAQGLTFLGGYGRYIVTAAVVLFATSTIISWSYYGEKAVEYLMGEKAIMPYRILYVLFIFLGSVLSLEIVWNFGDFGISLMVIPNLIALIALSKLVKTSTKEYFSRDHIPYS